MELDRFYSLNSLRGLELLEHYLGTQSDRRVSFGWDQSNILKHVKKYNWPGVLLQRKAELASLVLYRKLSNVIEIHYLETSPLLLRQGCMESLLTRLIHQHADCAFWLDVHQENEAAVKLYQKLGFEQTGLRRGYYRDGGTCLQLTKALMA